MGTLMHTSDSSSASEARQPPGAVSRQLLKAPAAGEVFNPANGLCALLAAVGTRRSWPSMQPAPRTAPRRAAYVDHHCNEALAAAAMVSWVGCGWLEGRHEWVAIRRLCPGSSAEGAIFSPLASCWPPSLPLPPPLRCRAPRQDAGALNPAARVHCSGSEADLHCQVSPDARTKAPEAS